MNGLRNIRLMVKKKLACSERIELDANQTHYLNSVMRCEEGSSIKCFNSENGEFWCKIIQIGKNKIIIEPYNQIKKPQKESDVWLLFAPLKKDKTDFVVEKAVELGVSRIIPVITSRTNVKQIKTDRYLAQAIEATEQCERLNVPEISEAVDLKKLLSAWDSKRILYFMDERRSGANPIDIFTKNKQKSCAFLIGPEGGFSDDEAQLINQQNFVQNVSLGPRILRAETAAAASLAVWQASAGDWQSTKEEK